MCIFFAFFYYIFEDNKKHEKVFSDSPIEECRICRANIGSIQSINQSINTHKNTRHVADNDTRDEEKNLSVKDDV